MGVLAIEQGRTNSLFELRPRDLFQRVIEMLGDHQVLERYRTARRLYDESQKELSHQMERLTALQVELQSVLREVQRLDDWERARDKVKELEAKLPAAEFQIILRRRDEEAAKLPALRTKVRNGETEAIQLELKCREVREQKKLAEARLNKTQEAESLARESWGAAREQLGRLVERVRQLEETEREVAKLPVADLQSLEKHADEAAQEDFAARSSLRDREITLSGIESRVERLKAGLPVYPDAVTETLAALTTEKIEAVLLADTIDIAEPEMAAAVESSLGNARYALLVTPECEHEALALATHFAFPGPVYTGPRTGTSETVGALILGPDAPLWLRNWIKTVELAADGTWRDQRGVWVSTAEERLLGVTGRQAALAHAEQECEHAKSAVARARCEVEAAHERNQTVGAALMRERQRQDLLAQLRQLPAIREEATLGHARLHDAEEKLKEATLNRQEATEQMSATSKQLAETETALMELKKRLEGEHEALQRSEAEVSHCDERIRDQTERIRPDLYQRATRGELDGPDTVRDDLRRATNEFADLGEPPPEEVREEAQHLQGNIEEAEGHVFTRRRESDQAQAELGECRRRYLEVVEGALQDYRRRAMELGERAAILVEMDLPRLEDNDRLLDEAAIYVRLGFDAKEALPLGDPSFSGGQQVIGGLILLMAMAETEGRGFYMLDEPFAHLSLDRVDDVGHFLRSTR
jgi:chromosome segregation ATPase